MNKRYAVLEDGILMDRELVLMDESGPCSEDRIQANAKAVARYDALVAGGVAVEVPEGFEFPIVECEIKNGTLQHNKDKEKDRKRREAIGKRLAEYPTIGDQLDAIMKWAFTENEIGLPQELVSIAAKCMSVKAKYPIDGE